MPHCAYFIIKMRNDITKHNNRKTNTAEAITNAATFSHDKHNQIVRRISVPFYSLEYQTNFVGISQSNLLAANNIKTNLLLNKFLQALCEESLFNGMADANL